VWIGCEFLQPLQLACTRHRLLLTEDGTLINPPVTRIGAVRGEGPPPLPTDSAIPSCPGDPRCPKLIN
jgi:hypothetical protein